MSASWPVLEVKVSAWRGWGRTTIEGYSHATVPHGAGYYELELACWRPAGTLRSRVREFFVGGERGLVEGGYVGVDQADAAGSRMTIVNKYGFATEPTGQLDVRMSVIVQAHVPHDAAIKGGAAGRRRRIAARKAAATASSKPGFSVTGGGARTAQDVKDELRSSYGLSSGAAAAGGLGAAGSSSSSAAAGAAGAAGAGSSRAGTGLSSVRSPHGGSAAARRIASGISSSRTQSPAAAAARARSRGNLASMGGAGGNSARSSTGSAPGGGADDTEYQSRLARARSLRSKQNSQKPKDA
jgi:hypothetical protein